MPLDFDGALSFGEMVLGYFQYLAIIVDIDINWPGIWKSMVQWVKMFKFDISIEIFELPIIDYRAYFLIVAVLVPLLLALLSLLYFQSLGVVIWYLLLFVGIGAVVIGSYMLASPDLSFGVLNLAPGWLVVSAGIFFIAVCAIACAIYVSKHRRQTREKIAAYRRRMRRLKRLRKIRVGDVPEEKMRELQAKEAAEKINDDDYAKESFEEAAGRAWEEAQQMKEVKEPRKSVLFYLGMLLVVAVLVGLALLSIGVLNLTMLPLDLSQLAPFLALGKIAGFCMMAAAAVLFLYTVVMMFQGGRNVLRRIRIWLDTQFIRIILFVLLIAYIPISQTLLTSWSCQTIVCPPGTSLPIRSRRISAKDVFLSVQNASAQCVPCSFITTGCPWSDYGVNTSSSAWSSSLSSSSAADTANCSCIEELCPGESAVRFKQDAGIDCAEVRTFFGPISIIMGVPFILGIPLLYYILVRYHAAFLKRMRVVGGNLEERWKNRTHISQNSAKSLYLSFEYNWRYYKVMLLLQKLLVVFCSIFIALYPTVLSIALCVVNLASLSMALATQPYVSRVMDFLSTTSNLTLLASSVLAALLAFGVGLPNALYIVVSVVNFVVPILAIVVGFIIEWRAEKLAKVRVGIAPEKDKDKKKKKKTVEVQPIARNAAAEEEHAGERPPTPPRAEQAATVAGANESGDRGETPEGAQVSQRALFALDWKLNTQTLKYITTFFVVVGVFSFVSLTIGLIGLFATSSNSATGVIGPTTVPLSLEASLQAEFAGYGSWDAFIHNCCCSMGENTTDTPLLEQWRCRNGIVKQRARSTVDADTDEEQSGLVLRPFCCSSFNSSAVCGLEHTSSGWMTITLCSGSELSLPVATLRTLW